MHKITKQMDIGIDVLMMLSALFTNDKLKLRLLPQRKRQTIIKELKTMQ